MPSGATRVRLALPANDLGLDAKDLGQEDASELRRAARHLQTLLAANALIRTELDLGRLFEKILDALFEAYPAHRAVLLTTSPQEELVLQASRLRAPLTGDREPRISSTIAYRAMRERVGLLTVDATSDGRFDPRQSILDQNICSVICAPMVQGDEVLGVIYLDTLGVVNAFGEDDLGLLMGIASAAASAVRNATLVARIRDTAADTIFRLAVAAEYRDDDTGLHIHRMSDYAAAIARGLGQDHGWCETIKLASPMHDVGKIGIPDAILKKPGRLTAGEFEVMKQHTVMGGAILANAHSELLVMAHDIALRHHERFDGTGYPHGLDGVHIPLAARIVAVADVFDAMTSRRCYKPAFTLEASLDALRKGAGSHFDPEVVSAFFGIQERILAIREHYLTLEASAELLIEGTGATGLLTGQPPPPAPWRG